MSVRRCQNAVRESAILAERAGRLVRARWTKNSVETLPPPGEIPPRVVDHAPTHPLPAQGRGADDKFIT